MEKCSSSAKEEPKAYEGQSVPFTGTDFTATDKLSKTYRYRMMGAEVSHDGLIRLLDLDTNSLTYVEPAWFRQRKIKVLQKDERDTGDRGALGKLPGSSASSDRLADLLQTRIDRPGQT